MNNYCTYCIFIWYIIILYITLIVMCMIVKLHDMYSSFINTKQRNSLIGSHPLNENNLEHYFYGCIETIVFEQIHMQNNLDQYSVIILSVQKYT